MQHPQHPEPQETPKPKKPKKPPNIHPNLPKSTQTQQKYKKARITSEKQTQNTNQTPNKKERGKTTTQLSPARR
jgi:hypothetical protein